MLGRDPSVDIVLNSPGISRQHARVTLQGFQYLIEDLGSSNGTFVNGQQITSPVPLRPNDQVALGSTLILVFQEEVPAQVETARPPERIASAPINRGPTVMGDEQYAPASTVPPQLFIAIAGEEPSVYTLTQDVLTIGRAEDNDIV